MKPELLYTKARSITIPLYKNPGPEELRKLWMEAKAKSLGDPNHCRFMIDKRDNIYVWAGERGMFKWVAKSLKMKNSDFSAFGIFRTEKNDPRKLDILEYVSKNMFMTQTHSMMRVKFMKLIHKLRLKKTPTFKDHSSPKEDK